MQRPKRDSMRPKGSAMGDVLQLIQKSLDSGQPLPVPVVRNGGAFAADSFSDWRITGTGPLGNECTFTLSAMNETDALRQARKRCALNDLRAEEV